MSVYYPDAWQLVYIKSHQPHVRVFAEWKGSFDTPDSWRLNSGIVNVEETDDTFVVEGSSGSIYTLHKGAEAGLFIYGRSVLDTLIRQQEEHYGIEIVLIEMYEYQDGSYLDL